MERPPTWGINHLKLPATDVIKTKDFYCDVVGMEYIPHFDHRNEKGDLFAVMVYLAHRSGKILIEFRHNESQAKAQEGWDPITFGVRGRKDLEEWQKWFEKNEIRCSRVFTGLKAWLLCALDPDGKIIRMYTDEEHEWTTNFDHDDFWLS